MRPRNALAACVALCIGFACLTPVQKRIDAGREARFDDELLYLPNEKLLSHFTGGMSSVVADVLWLQCIQYTSKHFRGDRKFTWLNHMCHTITRLDPYFGDVYRYGGVFLAGLKADDDASIELLESGIKYNPHRWELPYEIAVVHLLNRRDQPDSKGEAARYLALAAATGKAPKAVIEFAKDLQQRLDLVQVEEAMWREIVETSDDQMMRDMAKRKLQELYIRENCRRLTQAAGMLAEQQGAPVTHIQDLVQKGIVDRIPPDPTGGRYFFDADGKVKNTTIVHDQIERRLNRIRFGLEQYHAEKETWPASLQEACDSGHLAFIPPHPQAKGEWRYDPANGTVESVVPQ